MVVVIIILAWLGLAFGSFVNALVWRLHEQELTAKSQKLKAGKKGSKKSSAFSHQLSAKNNQLSILTGRSICPNCGHQLSALDLIPVFSWLFLRGRCRYCKKPISWQYPIVELTLALVFVGSYIWWPSGLHHGGDWILFVTWLVSSVGLLALLVYDMRWMVLPNRIIYPTFYVAAAGRLLYIVGFAPHKSHATLMWALSIVVASGIFWLLYIISNGKWIGFGDVRLGLVTGTILASPAKSFLMIFLGSVLGTLFILPALIARKKSLTARLPYGPFLIMATGVVVLFGQDILDWYKRTLGL